MQRAIRGLYREGIVRQVRIRQEKEIEELKDVKAFIKETRLLLL